MKNKARYAIYFLISLLLIAIDQFTKYLAFTKIGTSGKHFTLIKGVLEFVYVENTGAAWGILSGRQWFFISITILLSLAVMYVMIVSPQEKKYVPLRCILSVLLAGAVGNLIDRIANRYVKDFIYFSLIDFPVFNFADICVCVSMIVLIIFILFVYKDGDFDFLKHKKENKND